MKSTLLIVAISMGLTSSALAQDCKAMPDPSLRLACYDRVNGVPPTTPAPGAEGTPKPAETSQFLKELKLADEATPKGLGTDPATISHSRRDGENYSVIRAALMWESTYSPFGDTLLGNYGWGPYASLSINRNTLTTKRADVRDASAGLTGTIFNIKNAGFALYSKFGYTYREDGVDIARSDIFKWDNAVVADWLRSGIPYTGKLAWFVTPRFGLVHDEKRRAKAGSPIGSRSSSYVGVKLDVYPGGMSDRIRLAAFSQRFVDSRVDAGFTKRRDTFSKASIDYLLYSPTDASQIVQPSIALERTIGADPLNGLARAGTTQIMFRLKIN